MAKHTPARYVVSTVGVNAHVIIWREPAIGRSSNIRHWKQWMVSKLDAVSSTHGEHAILLIPLDIHRLANDAKVVLSAVIKLRVRIFGLFGMPHVSFWVLKTYDRLDMAYYLLKVDR